MKKLVLLFFLVPGLMHGAQSAGGASGARIVPPPVTPVTPATTPGRSEIPGQSSQQNGIPLSRAGTNMILPNTNGFASGTNQVGNTNSPTPTPIGAASNGLNNNFVFRDETVTPSDRTALILLRQRVQTMLGIPSARDLTVRFQIDNGVVTLVGTVPSAEEGQRILLLAQQTTGVSGVINHMEVASVPTNVQPKSNLLGAGTDRAFSPADQAILGGVRNATAVQLGLSSSSPLPIHFSIENGVVGVMGTVSSMQEKLALLAAIQRVPGVNHAVDDLQVTGGAAGGVTPGAIQVGGPFANSNLPPTSSNPNASNTLFMNMTNSSTMTP